MRGSICWTPKNENDLHVAGRFLPQTWAESRCFRALLDELINLSNVVCHLLMNWFHIPGTVVSHIHLAAIKSNNTQLPPRSTSPFTGPQFRTLALPCQVA